MVRLKSFLNLLKSFNISGVNGSSFLEKKVSMMPCSPFTPPRLYASKKAISFSCISSIVFPNMASSLFLAVKIVLETGACGNAFSAVWSGILMVSVLYWKK